MARAEEQLAQCPLPLREAFIEALFGTMQSFPTFSSPFAAGDITAASRMITEWESDPSQRTHVMNLVHLQTLILTALAADNNGPASVKGGLGSAAKASILGRAVGLAAQGLCGADASDEDWKVDRCFICASNIADDKNSRRLRAHC